MRRPLQDIIERLHARFSALVDGGVATYIPELGRADPAHFAICCATIDGELYAAGDTDVPFTIQSISKPFVFGLALDDLGVEAVTEKVGLEPSGEAFNAISLEWCEDRLLSDRTAIRVATDELPLAGHPLLRSLTPSELQAFSTVAARQPYDDRTIVVRQGEAADAIYFVVAGSASVQLNLPGERRHRLATLGAGAAFGELALLDDQPRTADVEAEGPLTCFVLRLDDLTVLDETAPAIRGKLMEALARDLAARLRRADLEIMTLAS